MSTVTQLVRPSGDETGETDRLALQAAFDDATIETVVLNGTYYIDAPLTCGPKFITGTKPAFITSYPTATYRSDQIRCVGTWTATNYALTLQGAAIANVRVYCNYKCRGVKHLGSKYLTVAAENLRVDLSTGIGYDSIDCWGTRLSGLTIHGPRGIAMRLHRSNSLQVDTLRISSAYLFRNTDADENINTWTTACDEGQAAAEVLEGYTTDWPDADETDVLDTSGNVVATPVVDRAALVISSQSYSTNVVTFRNTNFEPIYAGEYPSVCIRGRNVVFDTTRFESGYHRDTLFKVHNSDPGTDARKAACIKFRNTFVLTTKTPSYMVTGVNHTRNLEIDGAVLLSHVDTAAMALDGGTHYAPRVANVYPPTLAAITTLNGAAIVGDDIHEYGSHSLASDQAYYLGDSDTDGSWRIARDGDDLVMQRRESGEWVQHGMSTNIELVRPSGDTTGATDHANIQAALARLETATLGTLVLSGQYYINDAIKVLSYEERNDSLSNKHAPAIVGTPAAINVASGMTGEYAIEYWGRHWKQSIAPRLSNLYIGCNKLCRGILVGYQPYCHALHGVHVHSAIEVGIDLIDCWGATVSACHVRRAYGIGIRAHRFNSSTIMDTKIEAWGNYNSITANNAEQWEYDCVNGRDAAIAYYDGTGERGLYTEHWPAVDDEYVKDTAGDYVRTAAGHRAALVAHHCNCSEFRNVNLEASKTCSYPVGHFIGSYLAVTSPRVESAISAQSRFVVDKMPTLASWNVVFSNVHFPFSARECKYFVILRGTTQGVRVTDAAITDESGGVSTELEHIIYAEDGTHTEAVAERIYTGSGGITPDDYLGAADGATISGSQSVLPADQAYYLGDSATDGSWRMARDGDDLVMQRRESSVWVTKAATATVYATDYGGGWTGTDDTTCLQAAIDSGAEHVIVTRQAGPWVIDPITLASDQKITFEPFVEVVAKAGSGYYPCTAAYTNTSCLFRAIDKENITLVGTGATLRMNHADYVSGDPYVAGEWRHAISLRGCDNVTVTGFAIENTGGDGVYIGTAVRLYCSNIMIQDITITDAYRNAITVASAENLLVKNVDIRRAVGFVTTAPGAGVDCEPNENTERLVNCRFENIIAQGRSHSGAPRTEFTSTATTGFAVGTDNLNATSTPIDLTFVGCESHGYEQALSVAIRYPGSDTIVTGSIDFMDCVFSGGLAENGQCQSYGIILRKPYPDMPITFTRCVFYSLVPERDPGTSFWPIRFATASNADDIIHTGGVVFTNCEIIDPLDRPPMGYNQSYAGDYVYNITGNLVLNETNYVLDTAQLETWIGANYKGLSP